MSQPLIGEILISNGEITENQLNKAIEFQKKNGGLLGIILISLGIIDEKTLVRYLQLQSFKQK